MSLTLAGATALSGGLNSVSGLINTGMQIYENQKNRQFTAEENAKARAWQERMSNTAYQRTVQDLEKAGLNKMLAFGANPANMTASSATTANTSSVGSPINFDNIGNLSARSLSLSIEQDNLDIKREYLERAYKIDQQRQLESSRTGFGRG